ncbi:NERD domain-containing protein/DEAD/DEAH box helicase [Arthrobacter sp. BF1]|uniref:NERD domain-containing protein n=1 Tax=Arthrobacter sp. BF1 TaxID=2821145 RepID=UPI001C4EB1C6|nr:NERD domain-containing protein/DEAD/DEAH box helicase [Arthrobacter sp. BF1]
MRLIPPEPDFSDGQLAEKAVWDVLKASLPDDVVLVHSVQVRHGRSEHEIDILVLWPGVGLAAIEVKGGLVTNEHGQWFQSGGADGKHKLKDPLAQSQGSQHAFKLWLQDHMGMLLTSRFVYMAAFPYSYVGQDWVKSGNPRNLLLDQDDLKKPAELIRRAIEDEGNGTGPLAMPFLERIIPKLEGNLDQANNDAAGYGEDEDKQDHLTERQKVLLSATRSLPRIRFTGGAGSGKTWLAVEKARELCKSRKRVGLFCYNKGLGMYLSNQVSGWRQAKPAFTGEFHEFVKSLGVPDGEGQDYYDVEMPRILKELAADLPEQEKFDAVIVDEAQDFAPLWWEALRACLKDPDKSEIYAFMDDGQDVYKRWSSDDAIADLLPIHIDENLRNTKKIAETFKDFAGDKFFSRGSTGMAVRMVECATDTALDIASSCIDALIEDGWTNNQIALLTTKTRHPIHLEYSDRNEIGEYWREFHANESEFYGHVLGFKGLERSVVILCVNGFKDMERAAELLYVGLSRARTLLVVVGDTDLIAEAGGTQLRLALSRARQWSP